MTRKKVDLIQPDIVKYLRSIGCTVQHLHEVGKGCPDLLVGRARRNYLLELKTPGPYKSSSKLTDDEENWHAEWRGQVAIVSTIQEALKAVGLK